MSPDDQVVTVKCACGNGATQYVFLVIGRGNSRTGTETTSVDFYFCADCQRSDSEHWTVQNYGHNPLWWDLMTDYADLIPDGWELLEVDARDIPS